MLVVYWKHTTIGEFPLSIEIIISFMKARKATKFMEPSTK